MGGWQVLGLGRYCHRHPGTVPNLPRPQMLLLELQQRGSRPSIPQFYLHIALCPWPSKLLAPSITKAWLSVIILATATNYWKQQGDYIPLITLICCHPAFQRTCFS